MARMTNGNTPNPTNNPIEFLNDSGGMNCLTHGDDSYELSELLEIMDNPSITNAMRIDLYGLRLESVVHGHVMPIPTSE